MNAQLKLGEIITQIRGVSYKPSDVRAAGDPDAVALLRANNIQEDGLNFDDLVWVDKQKVSTEQYLRMGDILICSSSGSKGLVGKAAIVTNDLSYAFGAFCKVVRTKAEYASYLGQFFRSPRYRKEISASAAGANINNIRNEHIDEMLISMPSENERADCVAKLGQIDYLIQRSNNQSHQLDQLVKSRFIELFDNTTYDSNKVYLDEISDFVTVGIANSATHAYAESGVVMLRNQNIKENYLDENDLIYITPDFAKKYGSKKLVENDILVIRTGYPGIACLVPKKYEGCQTFTTLIVRLKAPTLAHANYVCHYINSSFGKDYVEQSKVGVAQQNFGAKALARMPILIPPMEIQEQFAAFVSEVDKSKLAVKQSLEKLETLKKSLMQQYFG